MNEQHPPKAPFETLGKHLKYLREQQQESLAEVSGAVEIEEADLEKIERGIIRPDEDILLLLITHFGMADQEAVQLWELAGYDGEVPEKLQPDDPIAAASGKSVVLLLAADLRTAYSDAIEINTTAAGVTLHFSQVGGQAQPMPVAKVGMSYEQAQKVLESLQRALLQGKYQQQPKQLPPTAS